MPSLKVDIHLPTLLFRKSPFLYVGPDFRSLPLGVLSDILEHEGERKQRLYPLTVYEERGERRIPLLFTFALLYIDNEKERRVLLSHPIYLGERRVEALESLLTEVRRLSRFLGSRRIEVEIHERVGGAIAFPTSLSFLSHSLDGAPPRGPTTREWEDLGFKEGVRLLCYEGDLGELLLMGEGGKGIEVEILDVVKFQDVRRRISAQIEHHSFHLSEKDPALRSTAVPFFEETAYIAYRRGWISSRPLGYMRWIPDLHEPLRNRGFLPFLFPRILENWRYRCGKVFDWGYLDEEGFFALAKVTVESMMKRGLRGLQFSNVKESDKTSCRLVESMGMRVIHRMILMEMEGEG